MNMKRLIPLISAAFIFAGTVVAANLTAFDPGPIPTCNGETATHVLVAETPNATPEAAAAAIAPYQSWIDQGVEVQANEDALLVGTNERDVLVALVSTNHGGIVGAPFQFQPPSKGGPTDGDVMCEKVAGAGGVIYATQFADIIITRGGSEDIYAAGCDLEPTNECDVIRSGGGVDFIWGYKVPLGKTQKIFSGGGMDHHYVGRGEGDVEITASKPGQSVCPHHGYCAAGDHVHECPNDPDTVVDFGLEAKNFHDIYTTGIEYWGPEALIGNTSPNDPCAIRQKDL